MNFFRLFGLLCCLLELSAALPAPALQTQLNNSELFRDLAMEYMPMFLLYEYDTLFPSSISFFAENLDCPSGQTYCNLTEGQEFSLDLPWLKGENVVEKFVPIYPLIVPRDADYDVVEIHYNTFFPFNEGIFGGGKHIGDWERVAIRFDRDETAEFGYEPTFAFLSRHSPFEDSWSGSWENVTGDLYEDNHFQVSVSRGDHANYLPSHDSLYDSGLCVCEQRLDLDWAKGKIIDWHAQSEDRSIPWKPYESDEQRDYIVHCDPWDGQSELNCDLSNHPEKQVFEKFGTSKWGSIDGEGLNDPPDSPLVQTEIYYENGIECTAMDGCARPDWCPQLQCSEDAAHEMLDEPVGVIANSVAYAAKAGETIWEKAQDMFNGIKDSWSGLFN